MLKIDRAQNGFSLRVEGVALPFVYEDGANLLDAIKEILNIRGVEIARVLEIEDSDVQVMFPSEIEGMDGTGMDGRDVSSGGDRTEPPPG